MPPGAWATDDGEARENAPTVCGEQEAEGTLGGWWASSLPLAEGRMQLPAVARTGSPGNEELGRALQEIRRTALRTQFAATWRYAEEGQPGQQENRGEGEEPRC